MTWLRRRRAPVCKEFVELITDYIDDVIPADDRARIDRHLRKCSGCTRALRQWRLVIEMTGHLTDAEIDQIDEATRRELTAAFRQSQSDDV